MRGLLFAAGAPHRTHQSSRILEQNLRYAPLALRISIPVPASQPFFGLVSCHVELLVEECGDLCVGFAHACALGEQEQEEGSEKKAVLNLIYGGLGWYSKVEGKKEILFPRPEELQ